MLNDPLYLGLKQKRLNGPEYDALVDEFVMATQQVFPGVLVQFEDFANHHAFALLERYRNACRASTTTSRAQRRCRWRASFPRCA